MTGEELWKWIIWRIPRLKYKDDWKQLTPLIQLKYNVIADELITRKSDNTQDADSIISACLELPMDQRQKLYKLLYNSGCRVNK
ncbi:MAG: hypothetical protein KGI06_05815 [Candidatus Micrarchaeota archaeon]|nr:hypothetical protein [Candidatus Micrarchaeota archaeon]